MTQYYRHTSVLLDESVELLITDKSGFYVDGTFGRGGHSRCILSKLDTDGRLLATDKDPEAIACAVHDFAEDKRFSIFQGSFAEMETPINAAGMAGKVQGILLDLGLSSPQLDTAERGFSFTHDGPLDMRMNPDVGESAADWLARATETEIADVIYLYGEERYSRRMAKAIVLERAQTPIVTTKHLARIVAEANPNWEKGKNPATRSFQGIRIHINQELEDLTRCLDQALELLAVGGHLVVISFHSLEDRIVKRFMRKHVQGDEHLPAGLPISEDMLQQRLKYLVKTVKPSKSEVETNVRARSAIMRAAIKVA